MATASQRARIVPRPLALAVVVALTALAGLGGTAHASSYPPRAGYGAIDDATLTVGQSFRVSAGYCDAGSTVDFRFESTALGFATAGSDGVASLTSSVPSSVTDGSHTIVALCPLSGQTLTVNVALRVYTQPVISGDRTTAPDGTMTVSACCFDPGSVVHFELHSTPISLGDAIAGADGVARLTVRIPAGVPLGPHTIYGTGTLDGVAVTATSPVQVTATATVSPALARTGSNSIDLTRIGLALFTFGVLCIGLERRRRMGVVRHLRGTEAASLAVGQER